MKNMRDKVPKPDPSLTITNKFNLFVKEDERLVVENMSLILLNRPYGEAVYAVKDIRAIIVFSSSVEFEPGLIQLLLSQKIPIIFFSSSGSLLGRLEPNWRLKEDLIYSMITLSDSKKLHLVQRIVWGSLRQHRRLLKRAARENIHNLDEAIQQIEFAINAVYQKDSISSVLGCLGAGKSRYYKALVECIRYPGWTWVDRSSALTPFNAMLNFLYELVKQSCITALVVAGFSPHSAIWREGESNGLALNLATEFKVFADAVLLRSINRGQISLKDFDDWSFDGIPSHVAQILVKVYEQKMRESFNIPFTSLHVSYQEMILFQAEQLRYFVVDKIKGYCPVSVK